MDGRRELAIDLLQMIVQEAPKSWRAEDAYGAALADAGNFTEAIRAFRRSLSMHPEGQVATEALHELRRSR